MSELRQDLRAISADGAASNVMVGIGETYLPAFVLVLSGSQLASGLITTLPMLAGALLQVAAPLVVRRWSSYRRWVVFCALLQALVFVPLIVAAVRGHMSLALLFLIAAVYWATGLGGGSAWNAWVETLVPARIRARFFARRALLGQSGILLGFVAGGVLLQTGTALGAPAAMFAVLFLAAGGSRLVSSYYLSRQREPVRPQQAVGDPAADAVASRRRDVDCRVLLCMLGTHLAVWIAAPYFTPYMLAHLHLSYARFVILICVAYGAKVLALPALGNLCRRWGARRVLWASGLAVAPLPALWLVSRDYGFLIVLQAAGGIAWGGFELAMLLLFFQAIPHDRRMSLLTLYNLAYAAALTIGSAIGGLVLATLGPHSSTYLLVFAVSTLARVAVWLSTVPWPRSVRSWRLATTAAGAATPAVVALPHPAPRLLETLPHVPAAIRRAGADVASAAVPGQAA